MVPLVSFWSSCLCFWCEIQKVTAKTDGKKTTSMYSSRGLIAYSLMLKFLIPFYLMFVYGKRQGHSFIFFKGLSSFLSAILKSLSFPHRIFLASTIYGCAFLSGFVVVLY